MLRTHTCGELNTNNIGKTVTLCGWVATRRDHGKLIFIDMRDRYGITQIVFLPKDSKEAYMKAQELRSEFVVKVSGKINRRPEGTINQKIPTGEIEILATQLEILNPSLTPPFDIAGLLDTTEEVRFKYRYLNLRRKEVFEKLTLRHQICKIMRDFLNEEGFIEFETPILTKSTPEGARDYLVPSRLNTGQFYALPQSPQLFKQILMVAGVDKYYQIAKCFRDEDLRADRQPEFTQLDLEMSFADEDDIFSIMESLMQKIFKEIKGIDLKLPFLRITYAQTQEKYSSDKPDLRKELGENFGFAWITDFPLFKYNEEEKKWESEHHPFTAPDNPDITKLQKNPAVVKSRSYDLILNGMEIGSGSIRIHNQQLQQKIFEIIGIDKEEAMKRFGFLLEAFQFGAPPHGGFAFGLDRLTAILSGEDSIREVIVFPKTSQGVCLLTGAPSAIGKKQLKELGIALKQRKS